MISNNHQSIMSLFPALINFLDQIKHKNSYDYKSVFDTYYSKLLETLAPVTSDPTKQVNFYERNFYIAGLPFTFLWEVEKLTETVETNNLLPNRYDVAKAYAVVDKSNILPHMLDKVSSDPVIIGIIPFITPSKIGLDGNHRVASAYKNNKDVIKAYILTPMLHTQAMHPYLRTLFLILSNVQYILQHIDGIIDLKELESRLYDIS